MLGQIVDWFYGQIVGFLGNFFSEMGNMGAELFAMSWVQSVVLFFSYLGWALFAIGLVVACFECGVEYSGGRGNVKETALNAMKGFLAVSLFTQVPVRLYELAVSLQADLTAGITGFGTTSIGDAAKAALEDFNAVESLTSSGQIILRGFGPVTSGLMVIFCLALMAYAVIKVFFANLKRGGILLIQIAVGSLYMLKDIRLLETYLQRMASAITQKREQISHSALLLSMFHYEMSSLSLYDPAFKEMLLKAVEQERIIQRKLFVAGNSTEVTPYRDVWKLYEPYGNVLRLKRLDFTAIKRPSLRSEVKYYFCYLFEQRGKVYVPLFDACKLAINTLADIAPEVIYFADITEGHIRTLVLALEAMRKNDGEPLSQYYIAKSVNGLKRIMCYLMSTERDTQIRAPRPRTNPFDIVTFHNLRQFNTPTEIIPEEVVEQLDLHREEMPCQYRLLYDLFMNTGLRLKEVYLLEEDCIEESRYPNVCQLKYIPHKTLSARHRRGAGDYHRIMIPKDIAGRLSQHIIEDAEERKIAGTSYIFRSRRYGYERAVIDSQPFVKCIRGIIRKYDICDENGELWHFTIKQFRKTLAVRLIENGATTVELAYWLGHLCSDTAAKYYAEVRKKKLAELNTEFFRSKFELIMTGEQLENYTQEERRLLYTDFCLGQRRVELGFCVRKVADGPCADRCSLYNCVNCRNLCTGKQYLPYWKGLLQEQEKLLDRLAEVYKSESITDYSEYLEYKQEYRLLESYQSVVNMIEKEGCI